METTASAGVPAADAPQASLPPLQRAVAVFTRPTEAWTGLREHAQWWFPLLISVAFAMGSSALLHDRAILPMMSEAWDRQVANGQLQAEQVDQMERFFGSWQGRAIFLAQQAIALPIVTLVVALLIWFGVGFVLGTGMKYRHALEVATWSSLITLPGGILTTALAWMKQTMRGVHAGFGILLPDMDPPSKVHVALGVILDALGPLSIWYLVVAIIGAAALSSAPRRSAAWVLGVLYLVVVVFMAALAALFTPAA